MNFLGRFFKPRAVLPFISTSQPNRWKVVDVKDVVKWKFVERPSQLTPSYTGDLAFSEPVDLKQPQLSVQVASDVLKSSDEITQRVLSLEFARSSEHTKVLEEKAVSFIQRHRFDTESPEAKIGRLTAKIRRFQHRLLVSDGRHNRRLRHNIVTMTSRRGGQLRRLRATDYRRFEWVLEQMSLVYRPPLPYKTDTTLSRKSGIRRMVQIFCDNVRQEKLDALRRQFDAEKPAFERERRQAVEWIAAEERALGLPSSVDLGKGCLLEPRLPKRVIVPPRREDPAAA